MYMLKYLKLESFYLFTHDRKGMGRGPYYNFPLRLKLSDTPVSLVVSSVLISS